jgi:hypothetical protein
MIALDRDAGEDPVVRAQIDHLLAGPGLGRELGLGSDEAEGLPGDKKETAVRAVDAQGRDLDPLGEIDDERKRVALPTAARQPVDRDREHAAV